MEKEKKEDGGGVGRQGRGRRGKRKKKVKEESGSIYSLASLRSSYAGGAGQTLSEDTERHTGKRLLGVPAVSSENRQTSLHKPVELAQGCDS